MRNACDNQTSKQTSNYHKRKKKKKIKDWDIMLGTEIYRRLAVQQPDEM